MSADDAVARPGADDGDYSGDEDEELRAKNQCGINIRFQGNEDDANLVLAPLTITFGKLLVKFAKVREMDPAGFRLMRDGVRITGDTTPKMLEWRAGRRYEVDCMANQVGGRADCAA